MVYSVVLAPYSRKNNDRMVEMRWTMAVKGQLSLAIHVKADVACAAPDCTAQHSQQIFFDPATPLDQLGMAFQGRSLEAVQALGWQCVDDLWYCPNCAKTRR